MYNIKHLKRVIRKVAKNQYKLFFKLLTKNPVSYKI